MNWRAGLLAVLFVALAVTGAWWLPRIWSLPWAPIDLLPWATYVVQWVLWTAAAFAALIQSYQIHKRRVDRITHSWSSRTRAVVVLGSGVLAICAVGLIIDNHVGPYPRRIVLRPSAYWRPQTHPDCRAVYDVEPLPDGRTAEVRAYFDPREVDLAKGEAVVFVTQSGSKPRNVTTFQVESLSMEIQCPPQIEVQFFVKDDEWNSEYWRLPMEATGGWQGVHLAMGAVASKFRSLGFDRKRGIAVGWQFASRTRHGRVEISLRNVRLVVRPTNAVPPVKRLPRAQYVENCGVDLRVIGAGGLPESGVKGDVAHNSRGDPDQLDWRLSYLSSKHVRLVRVPVLPDLAAGLVFRESGQLAELHESVYEETDALLSAASRNPGMRLLLVLLDGRALRDWPTLILDSEGRSALCDQIILPWLARYRSSEVIYGVEVISDPEAVAEAHGDPVTVALIEHVLETSQRITPRWKLMIGHGSWEGLKRLKIRGFDAYTFWYDPAYERHQPLKRRRDRVSHLPADVPVMVVARMPLPSYSDSKRPYPPYTPYVLQDAFDYGYSGVVFGPPEADEHRVAFRGGEAESFSSWLYH